MTTLPTPAIAAPEHAPAFLPLLFLLFAGSGCAALIYEIVWFQLLEFAIGSTAFSMGVLLGTFMGGMCLGSLLFSRLVSRRRHPLRVYALLELSIGILAILISLAMPLFDNLYVAIAHMGGGGITIRAILCALCLLPPTLLMGATLPAMARWIELSPRGISWLGFFYGGNTLGAVVGSLLAGFFLLRNLDMTTATYLAAAINFTVALAAMSLSLKTPSTQIPAQPPAAPALPSAPTPSVPPEIYFAIGLSGMAALGAEVVWTRLLSLLLGGTVYTFSIILAVFLAGLGIGSSVGAMLTRNTINARLALAWCQLLVAASIAWTAYALTTALPNWPVNPYLPISINMSFQLDLARCCWGILLPTIFWGASFPLAIAAASRPSTGDISTDPAKLVGRVYAANTVGAIIGALAFSLWFIPSWGTQSSEHILIGIAGLSAFVALFPHLMLNYPKFNAANPNPRATAEATSAWLGALVALLLAMIIPYGLIDLLQKNAWDEVPWKLVGYGRRFRALSYDEPNDPRQNGYAQKLYLGEGMNSSVAVSEFLEDGQHFRSFHVSGKVEASTKPIDMRLQLMLGHFPALFHPNPKKVLIVGCGAGVTAGSFRLHPSIEKIIICEIEPLIPTVVAKYFGPENNFVVSRETDGSLSDKRVQIVYDDARHYILTTDEKFDIITSDPIHPWVKGAASLYTREYFDLVKAHLNPGGIVTQWVPLYESSEAVVQSEAKTFFETFPNGTIWSNDDNGAGYDVMMLGSNGDFKIDANALQARLKERVLAGGILTKVNFKSAMDMLLTYSGQASDLKPWLQPAEINYDRNLRLQYLAGESLNLNAAGPIYSAMVAFRKYPANLLITTKSQQAYLQNTWSGIPPETAPATTTAPTQPATTTAPATAPMFSR